MESCSGGVLALLSSMLIPSFFHIFNGYVEVKLADCWPLPATFL